MEDYIIRNIRPFARFGDKEKNLTIMLQAERYCIKCNEVKPKVEYCLSELQEIHEKNQYVQIKFNTVF